MRKDKAILVAALFLVGVWISPVRAQIHILGGLSYEKEAMPGEVYEGEIIVANKGEGIQEVKLYQTDYLFLCDGSNIYGEPGKASRSNATWITIRPKRLKVAPKAQETVHYAVKVPKDGNLLGTYWSMLMVEPIPKDSPESSQPKADITVGVRQIFRYGIQIATHIKDTGQGRLKFLDTRLLKEGEKRILQVDIENTGERFLRPSLFIELYDKKGGQAGKYEAEGMRTYPSTSVRYKVDLGQIAEGMYKALIIADCGGDDIFGATYSLRIE